MVTEIYAFGTESVTERDDAQANLPETSPLDPNDPDLGGDYDAGLEVISGDLAGARILYNSNEPVIPEFEPLDELPVLDTAGVLAVGVALNLHPPTVFSTPVRIFIPCPGYSDVSALSVYLFKGTQWVRACDRQGNVEAGGEACIVSGSRVNHNDHYPPTIEIQGYHFSGYQAAADSTAGGAGQAAGSGGGGSSGCFISTAADKLFMAF